MTFTYLPGILKTIQCGDDPDYCPLLPVFFFFTVGYYYYYYYHHYYYLQSCCGKPNDLRARRKNVSPAVPSESVPISPAAGSPRPSPPSSWGGGDVPSPLFLLGQTSKPSQTIPERLIEVSPFATCSTLAGWVVPSDPKTQRLLGVRGLLPGPWLWPLCSFLRCARCLRHFRPRPRPAGAGHVHLSITPTPNTSLSALPSPPPPSSIPPQSLRPRARVGSPRGTQVCIPRTRWFPLDGASLQGPPATAPAQGLVTKPRASLLQNRP